MRSGSRRAMPSWPSRSCAWREIRPIHDHDAARVRRPLGRRRTRLDARSRRPVAEERLDVRDRDVARHVADDEHDRLRRREQARVPLAQRGGVESRDARGLAFDGEPVAMSVVEQARDLLAGDRVRLVLLLLEGGELLAARARHLGRVEARPPHDVREQREERVGVLGESRDADGSGVPAGARRQRRAHLVHRARQCEGVARAGAALHRVERE